jgi:hypothetical protein
MAVVPATQAWVDQLVTARMAGVQNAMSIDIRAEFEETKTRLRAEFEETKTRMTASIDGLQSATDVAVSTKFAEANTKFVAEQKEVRELVDDLKRKWDLIQGGSLKMLGDRLAEKDAEDINRINQVAVVFRGEVKEISDNLNIWKPSIEANMQALSANLMEARGAIQQQQQQQFDQVLLANAGGGAPGMSGSGGSSGFSPQERRGKSLEVRIPDPRNWALDVLQNGEKDWYAWRKSFDLQVRFVWGDLDKVLVEMRDYKEPMDESKYVENLKEMKVIPDGGNPLDYGFKHVSNKLYMILHMYAGDDAQKVIEESFDRCGFEAYRLLSIAYDPLSVDAEDQLIRSVLSIGNWSVKGIIQIESMMKEAHVCIRALENAAR